MVLDISMFEFLDISVTFGATLWAIFHYSQSLGIYAAAVLLVSAGLSIALRYTLVPITQFEWIKRDDEFKATNVETLAQVSHIRSSFASDLQDQRIQNRVKRLMSVQATSWSSSVMTQTIIRILYITGLGVVGTQILSQVQNGQLDTVIAISLIIAFASGQNNIVRIGRMVEKFGERVSRIQDLYEFIRGFGKQTFPVLQTKQLETKLNDKYVLG
jgi:hypothetical protein